MTWPTAFALTLLIEIPVVLWMMGRGWRRDLPWALLANSLSHPTLWFILPPLFTDYTTYLIVSEAAVFAFEALLYALVLRSVRGLAIGVAANALSLGVGLLIVALG
jgi:hypothetical protein